MVVQCLLYQAVGVYESAESAPQPVRHGMAAAVADCCYQCMSSCAAVGLTAVTCKRYLRIAFSGIEFSCGQPFSHNINDCHIMQSGGCHARSPWSDSHWRFTDASEPFFLKIVFKRTSAYTLTQCTAQELLALCISAPIPHQSNIEILNHTNLLFGTS
jgi:hypothetical protein